MKVDNSPSLLVKINITEFKKFISNFSLIVEKILDYYSKKFPVNIEKIYSLKKFTKLLGFEL